MQHAEIIARTIAEIKPRFLAAVATRLDRFEVIRDQLPTHGRPAPLLEELRIGAHRTVGLAASMGYVELGELSQKVEMAIEGGSAEIARSAVFLAALDDLLVEMALAVAA